MSLDLIQNALYQVVKANQPTLTFYPVPVPFEEEQYPNLRYVEVGTDNLGIKAGLESITFPTGAALPAAPLMTVPVLARRNSRLRLQLRDSLGAAMDASAYQAMRDQFNALDRLFSSLRVLTVGDSPRQTLAEFELRGSSQRHDPASGVFLSEFEVDVLNWRLLATGPGIATYRADSISLDLSRDSDGRVLITRLYPIPTP